MPQAKVPARVYHTYIIMYYVVITALQDPKPPTVIIRSQLAVQKLPGIVFIYSVATTAH